MRSKSKELMKQIIDFIETQFKDRHIIPSQQEIANHFNLSKACVSNYISDMEENGMLERNSYSRGLTTNSMKDDSVEYVPLVGSIACGPQMLAEENIERYIPIAKSTLGNGKHFALIAKGESMENAGIDDGDCVVVRVQDTAEEGQIVVALIEDSATLKRYYIDRKRKQVRLHPENDNMEDMFFDNIKIQGVALSVTKNLF